MSTRQEWMAARSARVRANLRRAMDTRGVGVVDLAERSGVRPHILRAYLDGDRTPSFAAMQQLADALSLADGAWLDESPERFDERLKLAPQPLPPAPAPLPVAAAPAGDSAEIVGTVIAAAGMSEQQFAGHLQHLLADPAGKAYLRVAVLGLRKSL